MKQSAKRAVFLDRDGVVNEMVYYPEHGIADSPYTPSQFKLVEGITKALRSYRAMGYELILVSNQPGIAKGHFSMKEFNQMRAKMNRLLADGGVRLDAEYYCFHHPNAKIKRYRENCDCRKPKPGSLIRAAKERGLSLSGSVMVGDGLADMEAGSAAGCRTVMVANPSSYLIKLLEAHDIRPDYILRTVQETIPIIKALPKS